MLSLSLFVKHKRYFILFLLLFLSTHISMGIGIYSLSSKKQIISPIIHSLSVTKDSRYVISWSEINTSNLKQVNIYRQDTTSIDKNWILIGSINNIVENNYLDFNSNSNSNNFNYKISYIDSCNVETFSLNQIKSIKLNIDIDDSNTRILKWDKYEGLIGVRYMVYKGLSPESLICIDSIENEVYTYTDKNFSDQSAYYKIVVEGYFLKTQNEITKIRLNSNHINVIYDSIINPKQNNYDSVFPNPIRNNSTIYISNDDFSETTLKLFDLNGNVLMTDKTFLNTYYFNQNNINQGIYIMQISNKKRTTQTKVLITE